METSNLIYFGIDTESHVTDFYYFTNDTTLFVVQYSCESNDYDRIDIYDVLKEHFPSFNYVVLPDANIWTTDREFSIG